MKVLKYFFENYFNQGFDYTDLDYLIKKFKTIEDFDYKMLFITELHQIIQTKNYAFANKIIEKTEFWSFKKDLKHLEKLLNYIYDRLIDRPTTVKALDFVSNLHYIPCPSCCPDIEDDSIDRIIIIEKATIRKNNMPVYICKPCSLIWLTENFSLENALNYKEYMKSLGLHGSWKELRDREIY